MIESVIVRDETAADHLAISQVVKQAFADVEFSDKREADIVIGLRTDNALSLSLVAEHQQKIVGHIAFSKVSIDGDFVGWYGLAPVSVLPGYQGKGIGSLLITNGLKRIIGMGAKGCVVLGEPDYYQKFGFESHSQLVLPGIPSQYFMSQLFNNSIPSGKVSYHSSFE